MNVHVCDYGSLRPPPAPFPLQFRPILYYYILRIGGSPLLRAAAFAKYRRPSTTTSSPWVVTIRILCTGPTATQSHNVAR